MMRPKRVLFNLVAGSTNNIALSQAVAGAVALNLNGALAVDGRLPRQSLGYLITFTSIISDESGKTFFITGFDADGKVQTETVTGPGAGLTVVSTKYFSVIASIVSSAALTGNISVGTPNTVACAVSPTYCLDIYTRDTSIALDVEGTVNYDIQKCFERPTAGETPNWVAGGLTGKTADDSTAYTSPTGAVRLKINSYTNSATIAMSILQARSH